MKALIALAIVAALGWLGYDHVKKADVKAPAPVQVNVQMPQPLGGTAPAGDKIYVP
ncbi:MAG TPA: hypothetical protein VFK42_03670 [Acidimicrobiales bacterium]|nr:hypothetical protein [Acidimicrobiales bacterium]